MKQVRPYNREYPYLYAGEAVCYLFLMKQMKCSAAKGIPFRFCPARIRVGFYAAVAWGLSAAAAQGQESVRFERPGLVADRVSGTVRIAAETTAVPANEPMEFFLIHRRSGHDYEAFAVTDVLPSDIHRALRWVGLEPGRGTDYEKLRFWPSGPRVSVCVEQKAPDAETEETPLVYYAEDTILHVGTQKTLPRTGFVFSGSVWLGEDSRIEGDGYAADDLEPHAVVTFFNLPTTVLDVPRRAPQSNLYSLQVRNPEHTPPEKTPVTVIIEPIPPPHPEGWRLDTRLFVSAGEEGKTRFRIETEESVVLEKATGSEVTTWMAERADEGREIWCTPVLGEGLSLSEAATAATLIQTLSLDEGLRVNPPARGDLYFQTFLPPPNFRDRSRRPDQPWELHLRRAESGLTGRMIRHERDYPASLERGEHVFTEPTEAEAPTPEAFRSVLDRDPSRLSVLLVFAPADSILHELNAWIRPALTTHPIVYLFPDSP